jgi:tetratricopeptide (TPR) repeat protein
MSRIALFSVFHQRRALRPSAAFGSRCAALLSLALSLSAAMNATAEEVGAASAGLSASTSGGYGQALASEVTAAYIENGVDAGHERLVDAIHGASDAAVYTLLRGVSEALDDAGEDAEAADALDVWVSIYPDSAEVYSLRGTHHLAFGRRSEALADFREAEQLGGSGNAGFEAHWVEDLIESVENPMCMPDYILEGLTGDFGPYHVRLKEHRIYYHGAGVEEYLLSAMDEYTFRLEGRDDFRIRFVADDDGVAITVAGIYLDGREEEFPRDAPAGGS